MRATAGWTIAAFILRGVPLAVLGTIHNYGDAVMVAAGVAVAMLGMCRAI